MRPLTLSLDPTVFTRRLALIALVLVVVSSIVRFGVLLGGDGAFWGQGQWLTDRFYVDYERNIPTFFAVVLLLLIALLLAFIATFARKHRAPYITQWRLLAVGFLLMAYDEAFSAHEMLSYPIQRWLGQVNLGVLYSAWVLPGVILVILLTLYYMDFLRSLETKTRYRFLIAGAFYLLGALGSEIIAGPHAEQYGVDTVIYSIMVTVEESLELTGLILFIGVLLRYIHEYYGGLALRFSAASEAASEVPPVAAPAPSPRGPSRGRGRGRFLLPGITLLLLGAGLLFIFRNQLFNLVGVSPPRGAPGIAVLQPANGLVVTVFAEGLDVPRFMTVGPNGHLYVAERGANRVVVLIDGAGDEDGMLNAVHPVVDNLDRPSSLTFSPDGQYLYIGEVSRVSRVKMAGIVAIGEPEPIVTDLPERRGHTTTTVAFGTDGWLYVSRGSSCNVCDEEDPRLAAIWRYRADGSGGELVMRGLRNAVGLAVQPSTGEMWASNNGRDMLGNHIPPETVYRLQAGADAGWPRCHAGTIIDPDFGSMEACQGVAVPEVTMTAHSAPLGMTFYDHTLLGAEYSGDLFLALHGSWNRVPPTGYKVVRIVMNEGKATGEVTDFVTGWLQRDGNSPGRPADVVVAADGALLISDDKAGIIYRVVPYVEE